LSTAVNKDMVIEEAMLDFLNSWNDKPCEIKLDELEKEGLSMCFQPLSGAKTTRKYINGSYSADFPFAIIVRVNNFDTKAKIKPREIFQQLDEWFSQKDAEKKEYINLPTLSGGNTATKIEMTATPAVSFRYENGTDDYQAVFQLKYKHKEEKVNA